MIIETPESCTTGRRNDADDVDDTHCARSRGLARRCAIGAGNGPHAQANRTAGFRNEYALRTDWPVGDPDGLRRRSQYLELWDAFGEDLRGPSANWGVFDGIEVGGAFIDREGESNKGIVNAKINIIPENFKWFEVGVGVVDAADALEQTLYVVASADLVVPDRLKNQAIGLRGHVGAGTGMFQDKVFGGGELWLDEKFSLVGEWDTRNFNGGFRYVHDSSFRLQIGFQHTDFFLSAGYILRF